MPVSYTHLDVYKRQLFALAAYAVQATVNLNLPVAMPMTVQLLAMGVSRQLKKKENESI